MDGDIVLPPPPRPQGDGANLVEAALSVRRANPEGRDTEMDGKANCIRLTSVCHFSEKRGWGHVTVVVVDDEAAFEVASWIEHARKSETVRSFKAAMERFEEYRKAATKA